MYQCWKHVFLHLLFSVTINCIFIKKTNKKTFQSNANRLLANSPGYIVNKFEHVNGDKFLCSEVQVEQVWRCPGGGGGLCGEVHVEQVWTCLEVSCMVGGAGLGGGPHVTCAWPVAPLAVVTWDSPVYRMRHARLKILPFRRFVGGR